MIAKLLPKKWFAAVGMVLCTLLWGSASPVIKYAYGALMIDGVGDKVMFAGVRFMTAGLMVLAAAWIILRRVPTVPVRMAGSVTLYGVVGTGLMYILNYIGVSNTTATKTCILTASAAFFAVILAPLFFRTERLTALKLFGVTVGFGGIIPVNLGDLGGGFSLTGEGFVLAAAVLSTAGSFIGKRISKGRVMQVTAWGLIAGSSLILVVGLAMGGSVSFSVSGLLLILYLAFVTASTYILWMGLLAYHPAGSILVYHLLIPVFGALWSLIILGERQILDPMYLLSIALISVGIFLVNYNKKS